MNSCINSGETFHQALTRELFEETGIRIEPDQWKVSSVGDSLQSNRILIFGLAPELEYVSLDFKSNETMEVLLIDENVQLAFPLHDEVKRNFFWI